MPAHQPHRKQVMARRATRSRIRKWLIRLDRIFLEIKLERKDRKK